MNFSKIFHRSSSKHDSPSSSRSPSPTKNKGGGPHSATASTTSLPASPRSGAKKSSARHGPSHSRSRSGLPYETHPLNLPPEERAFYQFANMAAAEDKPASTPVNGDDVPSSPAPSAPGAFPTANGSGDDAHENGEAPQPPPHKTPSSPPPAEPEAPPADPEDHKAQGNKFFKLQQYDKAIEEYTKGALNCCSFAASAFADKHT